MQLCKAKEVEFGPFPIPGVDNVTFAGLTEHPDGGFTAMIAMKKGAVIPEHGHKHFEETYVVSGAVTAQEQRLKPVITSELRTMRDTVLPHRRHQALGDGSSRCCS